MDRRGRSGSPLRSRGEATGLAGRALRLAAAVALAACPARPPGPLRAFGTVEAREVRIASRVGGRVARVLVEEGDRIRAGAPLVELDLSETEEQLAGAQAAARAAAARERALLSGQPQDVAAARSALEAARTRSAAARRELARAESLARGEAVPPRALDDARTAAELAEADVAARVSQLEKLVGGARGHEIAAAAAQRAQAEAAVARLEDLLRDRVLAAPVSGSVLHRLAEAGEVVRPAAPLLVVGDLSRPWVDVYVPEPRVGEVVVAQRAEVRVDAWPGRTFAGVVRQVASEAEFTPKNVQTEDQRARLVFRVRVDVEDPGGLLRPGMPAQVRFFPRAPARPAGASAARTP